MRQNGFPTTEDLITTAPPTGEEAARAVAVATRAAEILTKTKIRAEEITEKLLLMTNKYVLLAHFPITRLRVDGKQVPGQFEVDLRLGMIVNYDAPQKEYEITYLAGYVEGEMPQIYGELIRQLASIHLGGEGYSAEDVGEVAKAAIRLRAQQQRTRESL